jgi:SSS family solute:Na+ symporter
MEFSTIDIVAFVGFLLLVIGVSLWASRKEETSEDYFLAGRGLSWWVIGLSLIASNISTEHFIGMAGQGFSEVGLAIASYEWIAAFTLILVALFLLPRFLRSGIYTIPEYLEYRYNRTARTLMSVFMLFFYVAVTMATVLFAGAKALHLLFGVQMGIGIWVIGLIAGLYTVYGGLKAVVWSDVVQGSTLMLGGMLVTYLGFEEMGGVDVFLETAKDRLHTVMPADHPDLPWVAVFFGGMWIPNIFYWGLNQFITQRTLAAKDLEEGQKGILFGASLKLLIPFIIVFPGIMAFELYGDEILALGGGDMKKSMDFAYPFLFQKLLPTGLLGIMLAALFGATMSTLDSLLNSAATIFTMDIYKPYVKPEGEAKHLVKVGRITTLVLMVFACLWAPILSTFDGGIYEFIQKFWGFVQPGLVAAFLFGILWKKVPSFAAIGGILLSFPVYGGLLYAFPDVAFLHHMGITFLAVSVFITISTLIKPLKVPVVMPVTREISTRPSKLVIVWSVLVALATISLYWIFR